MSNQSLNNSGLINGNVSIDTLLAFGFGVFFILLILIFAVMIPNPTEFTIFVFRVVLSLAAAGVGAVLPGLLNISFPGVRASGALALAIMVYFVNPPSFIHETVEKKARASLDDAYSFIARGNLELARDYIEKSKMFEGDTPDIPFYLA